MSSELTATSLRAVLVKVERMGIIAARTGLIGTANALVKQARSNASNGRHAWGTPTPATPGQGPAVISGTLRRSIIREAVKRSADGWETKVGMQPGKFAPYNSRTPSSRYALYLETGLKNGTTYPFLKPATRLLPVQAQVNYTAAFAALDWTAADSS